MVFILMCYSLFSAMRKCEKKWQENMDIMLERESKVAQTARTTAWHMVTGKTKKAQAITMQSSVTAFFFGE